MSSPLLFNRTLCSGQNLRPLGTGRSFLEIPSAPFKPLSMSTYLGRMVWNAMLISWKRILTWLGPVMLPTRLFLVLLPVMPEPHRTRLWGIPGTLRSMVPLPIRAMRSNTLSTVCQTTLPTQLGLQETGWVSHTHRLQRAHLGQMRPWILLAGPLYGYPA
jgi:hypothetical protein